MVNKLLSPKNRMPRFTERFGKRFFEPRIYRLSIAPLKEVSKKRDSKTLNQTSGPEKK